MKRKSLFLISTLTLLGSFFYPLSSVRAEIIYNDKTYYTVSDLIEVGQEVEAAKIATCGEDYDYWCGEDVFFDQFFSVDAKYRAYDMFQHSSLTITAIDPYTNTAKIFYKDKDDMSWGGNHSYELQEFYLYWLDPSIDTDWTDVLDIYIDEIKSKTYDPEIVHVLFSGNQASDFEWLTPNEESTFELNPEAGYSTTQTVHFHAISNGASYGRFNLQECLSSPNHEDGMECAKVYGDEDTSLISKIPQSDELEEPHDVNEEPDQGGDNGQGEPGQPNDSELTDPEISPETNLEPTDPNPEQNEEQPELVEEERPECLPEEPTEPIIESAESTRPAEPKESEPKQSMARSEQSIEPESILKSEAIILKPEFASEPKEETSENTGINILAPDTGVAKREKSQQGSFLWPIAVIATEIALVAVCIIIKNRGNER